MRAPRKARYSPVGKLAMGRPNLSRELLLGLWNSGGRKTGGKDDSGLFLGDFETLLLPSKGGLRLKGGEGREPEEASTTKRSAASSSPTIAMRWRSELGNDSLIFYVDFGWRCPLHFAWGMKQGSKRDEI